MPHIDLQAILKNHAKWLTDPSTGRSANLQDANLRVGPPERGSLVWLVPTPRV